MLRICPVCMSTNEWVCDEVPERKYEIHDRDVLDGDPDILHVDGQVRQEGEGGATEENEQLQGQEIAVRCEPRLLGKQSIHIMSYIC